MGIFKKKKKTLGLALGGGAARGLTHIGVIKGLEEEGISIDYVTGTSAGSVVGALFCAGSHWKDIYDQAKQINWTSLVNPAIGQKGLLRFDKFEKKLVELLDEKEFTDLNIPFQAVTVDILAGQEYIIGGGNIAKAVRASCSIPGIFAPVHYEGRLLVDGGVLNDVPSNIVRMMGADIVIGVNLNSDRIKEGEPENVLDVISYSLHIIMKRRNDETASDADFYIKPNLMGFNYVDLKKIDDMVDVGEKALRDILPDLKRALS
jgi:NTE family protein